MHLETLSADLRGYMDAVEAEMRRALSDGSGDPADFYASMGYAMGWKDEQLRPADGVPGGKRSRPRLCLLSSMAAGGDPATAVPAAAAIEILHNFTLVHDDIQDSSVRRHHRPSMWRLLGVPLAINSGDGMFTAAHLALSSLARRGVAPEVVLHALEEFDRAALRVCEGQHMDISYEERAGVSSAEYLAMIGRKTGALMGLSCYLGALVASAPPEQLALYRTFGESLGTGYQIRDDLAGVWRDEASTGKRQMEDIYKRKKSYPAVRALELATGAEAKRLRAVYAAPEVTDESAAWVRDLMDRLGIHDEGVSRVRERMATATESLRASGAQGPAADALRTLAEGLLA